MEIKLTIIYVDDQDRALSFYTDVLGFQKKGDVTQGPYRWLTVVSPENPEGVELQLALNDDPAAKTFQRAMFEQGKPAAMFHTSDLEADYERVRQAGGVFTSPPSKHGWGSMAVLDDTCGNLIQLTQPAW